MYHPSPVALSLARPQIELHFLCRGASARPQRTGKQLGMSCVAHVHAGEITFPVPGRAGGEGWQEKDGPGLLSLGKQGKVEMRGIYWNLNMCLGSNAS